MEETQECRRQKAPLALQCASFFILLSLSSLLLLLLRRRANRQGRGKGKNKRIQNRGRDSAVAKACVSFHSMKFIGFDRSSPASLTRLFWTLWVSLPKAVGLRLCPPAPVNNTACQDRGGTGARAVFIMGCAYMCRKVSRL